MTARPLHGWGRHPVVDAEVHRVDGEAAALRLLEQARRDGRPLTPRGLGRSYGDSALGADVADCTAQDRFISFDVHAGVIECEAGVSLRQLLALVLPQGWFLPVTPGTWHVTVGGALASDVHGKNHHLDGAFSRHVIDLRLLTGQGEILSCSPQTQPELWRATCGGMGLTGLLLSLRLRLRRVGSSDMLCRTLRADGLEQTLALLHEHAASPYSVAWIDCLQKGAGLGRALVMLGRHADDGPLRVAARRSWPLPDIFPGWLLNPWSIRAFNAAYFHRPRPAAEQRIDHQPYFYPLDALAHWNRLYGRAGFLQYQLVLPAAAPGAVLHELLRTLADAGSGSFLAVLKRLGAHNGNDLSFPLEGLTLALDFPRRPGLAALLERLDAMVHDAGGRVYLSKDARLSAALFRRGYPQWEQFEATRARHGAHGVFHSLQAQRLGLA